MRRRIAAAAAALLAAMAAAGYVRTADRDTGKELYWATPIVTYHVNAERAGTVPSCTGADSTLDVVRRSFSAWEQSCTNLHLVYGGPTTDIATGVDGQNIVVFRKGWCSQNAAAVASGCLDDPEVDCGAEFNCFEDPTADDRKVLALTSVLYDPRTGQIVDADIEVNDWDGAGSGSALSGQQHGWYFTCGDYSNICESYGEAACNYMDLQSTVTHEAGHFFGLGHAQLSTATMFATAKIGDTEMRSLSSDDIAGVCAIYPDAGADGDNDGGCGCGSTGAAGLVPLLVAALALRRRPLKRR